MARIIALSFAALIAAQVPLGSCQAQAVQAAASLADGSPAGAAWRHYQDVIAESRTRMLANPLASDPRIREQALYYLQSQEAVAFNLYLAPRQQYPALYTQSFFLPLELSWGMPNPDFFNRNGFLDGAHTYRIYGRMHGIRWATLQVSEGFWGDDKQATMANVDFDELHKGPDGQFEIFLGPNPPADARGQSWIKLDPQNHNTFLALREVWYDWAREGPMEIRIETLDRDIAAPIFYNEEELARRTDKAARYVTTNIAFALGGLKAYQTPGGGSGRDGFVFNAFHASTAGRQSGGNPLGTWVSMIYDLEPDEALVIAMPVVEARYWGIQLGTVWGQTTDYVYHQSSINMAQAHIDRDGQLRAVLSLKDPGVPNWLDPAGLGTGMAVLRFYKAPSYVVPTVSKVKLAMLRSVLPADTPTVTPQQRKSAINSRTLAAQRRFGP